MPRIHENAGRRDDSRDVRRADVAESLAGGENQGAAEFGPETSRKMNAGPWTGLRCPVRVPALEAKQGVRADRDDDVPANSVGRPAGGDKYVARGELSDTCVHVRAGRAR